MMKTRFKIPAPAPFALCFLAAAGCAVGPEYVPPEPDAGAGWTRAPAVAGAPELEAWWRGLGDPTLTRLVVRARDGNLELRQAVARVAEARALRDAAAAGRLPVVDARASVTRRRLSENGAFPVGSIPGFDRDQTILDVGFDASWEADLFGRVRRAVEAADAGVGLREAERGAVELTVTAETARTYLSLRGLQRELAAARASVAAAEETLAFVSRRRAAGAAEARDVARAEAELKALSAGVPVLEGRVRAAALGLGVLTGGLPESELGLADEAPPEIGLRRIPVGARAELLGRRPDVAAAERALAAATAELGLAHVELYPRLAVSAAAGFEALDDKTLLSGDSARFSVTPFIFWRLLDGGRVRAQIRAADARLEAAALAWEQAVLAALADAEQALTGYEAALSGLALQEEALAAARRSAELAETRYRAGAAPFIDLLDARRGLHAAEDARARAHTQAATGLVALVKALGGGWSTQEELATARP